MKKTLFIIFLFCAKFISAQSIHFTNPSFEKSVLLKHPEIDWNKNGKIEKEEAESVSRLDLMEQNLTNADDVKYFKNIEYLSLTINGITKLKLHDFYKLKEIYCARNKLSEFEIANIPSLEQLAVGRNELKKVTIINCPNLQSINMMDNQIRDFDVKRFKKLKYLSIDNNQFEKLDLTNNPELIQIVINKNNIKTIDITQNPNLMMNVLYVDDNVKIIGTPEQMKNYTKAPIIYTK
ncbi:hypothetical protein NZD88_02365 [Chryseobacterium antibioticum]|uniref:Leucine-rich repeat domain-containing protein n=1 Tax=Chryseobacterium pyrolae TaxID=2987481 RepID=A0ABT2ICN5_9FLAO|nr:hypothetical protein [Chryseobacterium pyrolae]MCT2406398.1 hypothetical protein [Chryseobacterium pyrolae]